MDPHEAFNDGLHLQTLKMLVFRVEKERGGSNHVQTIVQVLQISND